MQDVRVSSERLGCSVRGDRAHSWPQQIVLGGQTLEGSRAQPGSLPPVRQASGLGGHQTAWQAPGTPGTSPALSAQPAPCLPPLARPGSSSAQARAAVGFTASCGRRSQQPGTAMQQPPGPPLTRAQPGRAHTGAGGAALTRRRCTVLDLGDVLHHVVHRLDGRARERLRRTCRGLRRHASILDSFTTGVMHEGSPEAADVALLAQLRNLRAVHLWSPGGPKTVFHLHTLTGLQRLCVDTSAGGLDLTPLTGLPLLQELELSRVQRAQFLTVLRQLTSLAISPVAQWQDLVQLTSLAKLELREQYDAKTLAPLQQLSFLRMRVDDWSSSASSPLLRSLAQLPRLSVLSLDFKRVQVVDLTPLTALAQLTALQLYWGRCAPADSAAMYDLSPLSGLRQLSVVQLRPTIISPSITCLRYFSSFARDNDEYDSLPDLRGCTALQHLLLSICGTLLLASVRLPTQPVTVSVDDSLDSRVFVGRGVQVQYVKNVSWPQVP